MANHPYDFTMVRGAHKGESDTATVGRGIELGLSGTVLLPLPPFQAYSARQAGMTEKQYEAEIKRRQKLIADAVRGNAAFMQAQAMYGPDITLTPNRYMVVTGSGKVWATLREQAAALVRETSVQVAAVTPDTTVKRSKQSKRKPKNGTTAKASPKAQTAPKPSITNASGKALDVATLGNEAMVQYIRNQFGCDLFAAQTIAMQLQAARAKDVAVNEKRIGHLSTIRQAREQAVADLRAELASAEALLQDTYQKLAQLGDVTVPAITIPRPR